MDEFRRYARRRANSVPVASSIAAKTNAKIVLTPLIQFRDLPYNPLRMVPVENLGTIGHSEDHFVPLMDHLSHFRACNSGIYGESIIDIEPLDIRR
jgi:hypothetical protein